MDLQTVDGETWLKIDGLWHNEHGALERYVADRRDALLAQNQAGAVLAWARLIDPASPEYDADLDPMGFLRVRVLSALGLPDDATHAAILAEAENAVARTDAAVQETDDALSGLLKALVGYATARRVESVAQRQFHDPDVVPVLARCVEQMRLTRIEVLVKSPIASGDSAGLRRSYDETVAAWQDFLRTNETLPA